jgi:hypothetical protein
MKANYAVSWCTNEDPKHQGAPIVKENELTSFEKTVYNIETEDHTYVANNFIVHNCQAFISWCLSGNPMHMEEYINQGAGVTAYCPTAVGYWKNAGLWHNGYSGITKGDIVYFSWNSNGVADHVGIVTSYQGSYIWTIEGNRNDKVEWGTRNLNSTVMGYGRPAYGAAQGSVPAPAPSPAPTPTPTPANGKLVVDGVWGTNTCKALQGKVGTPADGIWGTNSQKALQRYLGVTADGWLGGANKPAGMNTLKALQRKVGSTADGVWGPNTCKAVQKWLNA